jgi:hypothetical protein
MTLEFEPGASDPIRFRIMDGDRVVKYTNGATLQLRVSNDDGTCTVIATSRDPASGEFVLDTSAITLPARAAPYRALIYIDWGEGWRRQKSIDLKILEGC